MTNITDKIHTNMTMDEYLEVDAVGSSHLERLAISPLHYQHYKAHPPSPTPALALGTALHVAVLEPERFESLYALEPDLDRIGGAKPRATKAYKEEVDAIAASGRSVLRDDDFALIEGMSKSILMNSNARRILEKMPKREESAFWERDGVLCRARFDARGDGAILDLKTTRQLKTFSPWVITKLGYYRQAGWYRGGAERLGSPTKAYFIIAVENEPPFDVGVFSLEEDVLEVGRVECDLLFDRLRESRDRDSWPGMYPEVQRAQLTDAVANIFEGSE